MAHVHDFQGRPERRVAGDGAFAGQGRGAGGGAFAVGGALRSHRATSVAIADLVAAGRRRQLCPLCRAAGEDVAGPNPGRPRPPRGELCRADPDPESADWWELTQEERRRIFEDQSHHIATGLKYLPEIARQLYHCRDLGEPFDFLTWFEYAPQHASRFEDLVRALRASEEWSYVEREVDIRVTRIDLAG